MTSTSNPQVPSRRTPLAHRVGAVATFAAVAATLALMFIPSPYVIELPGPVFNTLGTAKSADGSKDVPLVTVPTDMAHPTTGALDMLTVSLVGQPGAGPNWISVIGAWLNPRDTVAPMELYFPSGQTSEQRNAVSAAQMMDSQQEAIAAALTSLGYTVGTDYVVAGVTAGAPADGKLQVGDAITAVNGTVVKTGDDISRLIKASGAGTPATFTVTRKGAATTVTVTPGLTNGTPMIGIQVGAKFSFPISVTISLNDVGGPSAGMMFALGIIDKLTPGDMTGGKKIAGTGTITAQGAVGAIGGIRQKMFAARDAGATYFLAPSANCPDAVGSIPGGLRVFRVSTLEEARQTLERIGSDGDLSSLPVCK